MYSYMHIIICMASRQMRPETMLLGWETHFTITTLVVPNFSRSAGLRWRHRSRY